MPELLKNKPQMLLEAQKARFKPGLAIQVLIFIAVFIVSQIAAGLFLLIGTMVQLATGIGVRGDDLTIPMDSQQLTSNDLMNIMVLFCTAIAALIPIIYCRFIERRSLFSMGFVRKKAASNYAMGLLIGGMMYGSAMLLCWVTGALKFNGVVLGNSLGIVILFFFGFLFQGISEEITLRGYFMISVSVKKSVMTAVLTNSILFSLLHILNSGISVLPLLNLTLFGVFASVYMLRTENIWGIGAIHSMWNFVQGNIFGIPVSGMELRFSVLSFSQEGSSLINGGSFGLEGGLAVTVVLVASIALTVFLKREQELKTKPQ